jgi:hypothetical protein
MAELDGGGHGAATRPWWRGGDSVPWRGGGLRVEAKGRRTYSRPARCLASSGPKTRLGNARTRRRRSDRRVMRRAVRRRDVPCTLGLRAISGRSGRVGKARGGSGTEARAPARWSAGASRSACFFARTASVRNKFSPNSCIKVQYVVNRKVVDLATLYNFCKGRLVFFSTDFAGTLCQH